MKKQSKKDTEFSTGSSKVSNKNRSYAVPVAVAAGSAAALCYFQVGGLCKMPSVQLPSYTATVGGAFQDLAFVPLSDVENAQRAVAAEMFPGVVNVAANPGVRGVNFGQASGTFRGLDPVYSGQGLNSLVGQTATTGRGAMIAAGDTSYWRSVFNSFF